MRSRLLSRLKLSDAQHAWHGVLVSFPSPSLHWNIFCRRHLCLWRAIGKMLNLLIFSDHFQKKVATVYRNHPVVWVRLKIMILEKSNLYFNQKMCFDRGCEWVQPVRVNCKNTVWELSLSLPARSAVSSSSQNERRWWSLKGQIKSPTENQKA